MSSSPSTEPEAWVDLSQPVDTAGAGGGVHRPPRIEVERRQLHGHDIRITSLSMGVHATTHVDAPRHFLPDGATIDELPLAAFIGPGVVVDARVRSGDVIDAALLRAARPAIEPGDVVFVLTGHGAAYGTPAYIERHPYLADDAAELLVELGARAVGLDTPTPDRGPADRGKDFNYPVHTTLIGGGVLIVENLGPGLARVAGERLVLGIMPLAIAGADGAPGVAFALRPDLIGPWRPT